MPTPHAKCFTRVQGIGDYFDAIPGHWREIFANQTEEA